MNTQTLVVLLTGLAGIVGGWFLRKHENLRVRWSGTGALVGGMLLLLAQIWVWIKG